MSIFTTNARRSKRSGSETSRPLIGDAFSGNPGSVVVVVVVVGAVVVVVLVVEVVVDVVVVMVSAALSPQAAPTRASATRSTMGLGMRGV